MRYLQPKDLRFKPALKFRVGTPAEIFDVTEDAKVEDVVYIGLDSKRRCLKVGETGHTCLWRWQQTARIFKGTKGHRDQEQRDREAWIEKYKGRTVEVWCRPAMKLTIDGESYSMRWTEELWLDKIFDPVIGAKLDGRKKRKRMIAKGLESL